MQNGSTWKKLTDEQARLLGNPTDELIALKTENARLIFAAQCFEQAVDSQFFELEQHRIVLKKQVREANQDRNFVADKLTKLVDRSTEFVSELTRLLQSEGLRLCEQNPAEVQAVVDRFHDHLADYQ